ncbi:MAG: glycerol-3-phosphate 1-O-acyltransferase PlsY [Dehalococcoidales bacterium]|nr:glycerol-3-phosphate 1-O-acyltransferase PlsY [Dehalococcoidales bacterium]
MIIAKYVAVALIGYLLGAIPFGLIIGKRYARTDIRQYGSGKTGTTNVLRIAGKKAALLVCLLDLAKGGLAVFIAGVIFGTEYLIINDFSLWWLARSGQVVAALAAVAGHTWPIYVKFKGGRGVATYLGALLVLCPPAGLFGGEILLIGAGLTKYVSLGSIAGAVGSYAILVPLTIMNGFPIEYLAFALLGAIFLIVMHRDNIIRLLQGKERKIGEKAQG